MRKLLIVFLVALLAVLGVAALGCGGDEETTTTAAAEDTTTTAAAEDTTTTEAAAEGMVPLSPEMTVNVAFDDAPGTAGLILADQMGYFKEAGIKINWVKFSSGAVMYQSLAAGQVDVGRGVITASLFNGAAQDVPVWLVSDSGTNVPGTNNSYFTLAVASDIGDAATSDPASLKGKKFGLVSTGSIVEYFTFKYLDWAGLAHDDVEYVPIAEFPDLNTALGNNAVSAAMQIEPLITSGEREGVLNYGVDADLYAPGEQVAVLLYSDKFAKNTQAARNFMWAHMKGVRVYNDAIVQGDVDRDNVISILTANTFVSDPTMWTDMRPTGLDPNGAVLVDSTMAQQDYFAELGQVEEKVTADQVIDESFAQWAVSVLGPYQPPQ